jgi:hypothetical protein
MKTTDRCLEEAGRLIHRAEQMQPGWDAMLQQVHVVSEQLRDQVQQAAGADPSNGQGGVSPPPAAPWIGKVTGDWRSAPPS